MTAKNVDTELAQHAGIALLEAGIKPKLFGPALSLFLALVFAAGVAIAGLWWAL